MSDNESLVGKWGVCSRGRIGKIEDRKTLEWGESWVGTGLDGTLWASRNPTVICDVDVALIREAVFLLRQFNEDKTVAQEFPIHLSPRVRELLAKTQAA